MTEALCTETITDAEIACSTRIASSFSPFTKVLWSYMLS